MLPWTATIHENKVVTYACDTTLCENFYLMCGISDYMIADATKIQTTEAHIGLDDYKKLKKQYKDCDFFAVHSSDYDISGIDTVIFPNDGDIVEI